MVLFSHKEGSLLLSLGNPEEGSSGDQLRTDAGRLQRQNRWAAAGTAVRRHFGGADGAQAHAVDLQNGQHTINKTAKVTPFISAIIILSRVTKKASSFSVLMHFRG